MKIFRIDSPLMGFLSRILDLMIISLLFVLCSVPVFTIGASATAMYRTLLDLDSDSGSGTFAAFFKAFRSDFKNSTLIFLILLVPTLLFIYELGFYYFGVSDLPKIAGAAFFLPSILLMFVLSYVYPLAAQFDNKPFRTIKNAFLLSILHFPTTVLVTFLNLLPFLILFFYTELFLRGSVLILFLGFAVIASVNLRLLKRIFKKYMPDEAESKEEPGSETE